MSFFRGQKSAPAFERFSGRQNSANLKHQFGPAFRGVACVILFHFLILILSPSVALVAQPVSIPGYTPQSFQSADMDPYFNQGENADTMAQWELGVSGGLALLESQWELQEDLAIDLLVASVSESDDFNSVNEYRDYVRKALEIQKQESLNDWMYQAEVLLALERDQFLSTLSGSGLAENQEDSQAALDKGESQSENGLTDVLEGNSTNPDADLDTLIEDSENGERNWENNFEDDLNSGLAEFSNSLVALDQEYKEFIDSLTQADLEFQNNLTVIQNYETQVRNGIQTSVGSLQNFLDTNTMFDDGSGGLNAQGQSLQDLIDNMTQGLTKGDPLSTLVQDMVDYLDQQIQYTQGEQQTWENLMEVPDVYNGYYRVAHAEYLGPGGAGTITLSEAINIRRTTSITGLIVQQVDSGGPTNSGGLFNIISSLNPGRQIGNITGADVCGITPGGWGIHTCYATDGDDAFSHPGGFSWWPAKFLEAEFDYSINYTWIDPAARANAAIWEGYTNDLTPLLATWRDSLLPATQAWETQKSQYETDYSNWQTRAAAQKTQYDTAYNANKTKIAQERNQWLVAMESEYRAGKKSWDSYQENLADSRDQLEAGDNSEDYYKELASKSAGILKNTLIQARASSKKLLSSRSSLSSLQKELPKLQVNFLSQNGQNLPDLKTMNSLLGQFEKSSKGLMNLTMAKAMSAHAQETRRQAIEQTAELARQYGFDAKITGNGMVRVTRQIATGNAVLKPGWDPTDSNAYVMEETAQNLSFSPTGSASLVKTGSLFDTWDQSQVQASFEANLSTFQERAQGKVQVAMTSMDEANKVAEARMEQFQASLEMQVAHWSMLKDLLQTLLTGGTMSGWVEGQMRSRVAAEIEQRTGWPAGFVSGMLGGSSMRDAAKSYMQGVAMQEIERVTGIPGLGGLVFEKFNERQAAKNSPTAKMSRTMSKLGTVGAAAMGFMMGGPTGMATAALAAHSQQDNLQKFYYENPMAMEATAMAAGPQAHTAYKAMKGYYSGGGVGAVASLADSALQITQIVGVSSNVSYSHENGWGGSIGVGAKAFGGTIGVSVSAQEGQGITNTSAGYKNDFMAAGVNYVKGQGLSAYAGVTTSDSRYSMGLGYSKDEGASTYAAAGKQKLTFSERDGAGVAFNAGAVNAKYSQRGGLSGGVSIGLADLTGDPRLKGGSAEISYNRNSGWGANAGFSKGGAGGNVSFSERGGFNGHSGLDMVNPTTVTSFDSLQSTMDSVVTERKKKYIADGRRKLLAETLVKLPGKDPRMALLMSDEEVSNTLTSLSKVEDKLKNDRGINADITSEFDVAERGSSRGTGFFDTFVGGITDDVSSLWGDVADNKGWIDSDGTYHQRVCFPAGTPIRTIDGYKEIQNIKSGDIVLAWSEKTGQLTHKPVLQTFIRKADLIYQISYEDGTFIETTWNHPFYIQGKGWVQAKDLKKGDESLTSSSIKKDSKNLKIVNIFIDERAEQVYNFEVSEVHTYFVSYSDVLVHNADYDPSVGVARSRHQNVDGKDLREITDSINEYWGRSYTPGEIALNNDIPIDGVIEDGQMIVTSEILHDLVKNNPEGARQYFRENVGVGGKRTSETELLALSVNLTGIDIVNTKREFDFLKIGPSKPGDSVFQGKEMDIGRYGSIDDVGYFRKIEKGYYDNIGDTISVPTADVGITATKYYLNPKEITGGKTIRTYEISAMGFSAGFFDVDRDVNKIGGFTFGFSIGDPFPSLKFATNGSSELANTDHLTSSTKFYKNEENFFYNDPKLKYPIPLKKKVEENKKIHARRKHKKRIVTAYKKKIRNNSDKLAKKGTLEAKGYQSLLFLESLATP